MIDCKGLAHVSLFVSDIEKTRDFYVNTLGFQCIWKDPEGERGEIDFFQLGDLVLEVICATGIQFPPDGCFQHLAIKVDNIEDTVAQLDKEGIEHDDIEFNPNVFPNGCKSCNITGPDGEHLEFNVVL